MRPFIAFLIFIINAANVSSQHTISIADFGLLPDTRENATPFVRKAMESITGKDVTLYFPKGRYDFWPQHCVEREYFESNTTDINPKRLAILIDKKVKFTLDGGGSLFIMHDRMQPVTMDSCDGVTDVIDKCPTVPGLASNNGCPVSDRDGDGVVDERDKCPDVAGPVNNTGCPVPVVSDRDKDGVVDQMDKCPDVAGPVNNEGCPVPAVSDRDKDGVLDQMDKCPDLAGVASNDGCPVSITRVVPLPAAASVPKVAPEIVAAPLPVPSVSATSDAAPIFIIHFNFDRYNLTYSAVKILDEVVAYCKINKTKRVYLYGHTDLEGGDQYNIKLSMNRVNIAKAYLLGKGVEASRIITDHFGKAQPALSTVEKSLGWKNRRVEIKIVN